LEDFDKGRGDTLNPWIIRGSTPYIEECLGGCFTEDLYSKIFCPISPSIPEPSPWVSLEESIFEGVSDRRRDFALPGKKISNPHNEVNVLHSCWAPEGAGAAGGAGP
jgi:hypothetical protein